MHRSLIKKVMVLERRTGLISIASLPIISLRIKRQRCIKSVLNFMFNSNIGRTVFIPMQVLKEINLFASYVIKRLGNPRYVLEIGTAHGTTLAVWCCISSDDATIVSIDLPGGPFGGGYPPLKSIFLKSLKRGKQRVYLIRGDSHEPKVYSEVLRRIGGSVDLLFIDGDHRYSGIRKDFCTYSKMVREGGIIALHDITDGPSKLTGGVPEFWRLIKSCADGNLIIREFKSKTWGGYGIGSILVTSRNDLLKLISRVCECEKHEGEEDH